MPTYLYRLCIFPILALLLCTGCQSPSDPWYRISQSHQNNILDSEIRAIEHVEQGPKHLFDYPVDLTFKKGQLIIASQKNKRFKPKTVRIAPGQCKPIKITSKKNTTIRTIQVCYRDQMLTLSHTYDHIISSMRMHRSPLWHQGLLLKSISLPLPLGLKNTQLYIKFNKKYQTS